MWFYRIDTPPNLLKMCYLFVLSICMVLSFGFIFLWLGPMQNDLTWPALMFSGKHCLFYILSSFISCSPRTLYIGLWFGSFQPGCRFKNYLNQHSLYMLAFDWAWFCATKTKLVLFCAWVDKFLEAKYQGFNEQKREQGYNEGVSVNIGFQWLACL